MYFPLVNRTWWASPTLAASCFIPTPASLQHQPSTSSHQGGPQWISDPVQASTAGTTSPLLWCLHQFLLCVVVDWNISLLICYCYPKQTRRTHWTKLKLTAIKMTHKQGENTDLRAADLKCPCMCSAHSHPHNPKTVLLCNDTELISKWKLCIDKVSYISTYCLHDSTLECIRLWF